VSCFISEMVPFVNRVLLPGTNGGYYPVMVRGILENGKLPFTDMPLFFYICAVVVRIISFATMVSPNHLIIPVLQVLDAALLPLCLLPLVHFLFCLLEDCFLFFLHCLSENGFGFHSAQQSS